MCKQSTPVKLRNKQSQSCRLNAETWRSQAHGRLDGGLSSRHVSDCQVLSFKEVCARRRRCAWERIHVLRHNTIPTPPTNGWYIPFMASFWLWKTSCGFKELFIWIQLVFASEKAPIFFPLLGKLIRTIKFLFLAAYRRQNVSVTWPPLYANWYQKQHGIMEIIHHQMTAGGQSTKVWPWLFHTSWIWS